MSDVCPYMSGSVAAREAAEGSTLIPCLFNDRRGVGQGPTDVAAARAPPARPLGRGEPDQAVETVEAPTHVSGGAPSPADRFRRSGLPLAGLLPLGRSHRARRPAHRGPVTGRVPGPHPLGQFRRRFHRPTTLTNSWGFSPFGFHRVGGPDPTKLLPGLVDGNLRVSCPRPPFPRRRGWT